MLRHLEEELECTLLIREGRKLRLTDSGQALYQRGLTILDEFRQLEAELEDISSVKRACCGWAFHRWWAGRSPI